MCHWRYDKDKECWFTECGNENFNDFIDDFVFCPYCGDEIVVHKGDNK